MDDHRTQQLRWRPGVYAVRRDAEHLQVGIDPPLRAVISDTPAVRGALRHLAATPGTEAATALQALHDAGLLLGGGEPASAVGCEPATRRAAEAQFGEDAARRMSARAAARVAVRAERDWHSTATGLLRSAGVGLVGADQAPQVWLVVNAGEHPREELDPLVRDGVPHLLLSVGPIARVGPFVVPGATACQRCLDAHLAEADPRRPLVVEQAVRAARAAGDVPVDPTLAALALAWAARELSRYVEGDRPATWSSVIEVDHAGAAVHRSWERHPHCGCAWDVVG